MILSIIIPTFNSAKTLKRTLDSIVSQTFPDWEVLIMDCVSKDETVNIAKSYNDDRIRIYSEPDYGIYDAMNKGIDKAQGEWLYFLGSDDWIFNTDVFSRIMTIEGLSRYHVVYGYVNSDSLPKENQGEWSTEMLFWNRCHQAIFYKKEFFATKGKYNIFYRSLADFDVNLRWLLDDKVKKLYVPICIANYSDGGFSSDYNDKNFEIAFPKIVMKYSSGRLPLSETDMINNFVFLLDKYDLPLDMKVDYSIRLLYLRIRRKYHNFTSISK